MPSYLFLSFFALYFVGSQCESCQSLFLVPAYSDPSSGYWSLIDNMGVGGIAVMNPNSGPTTSAIESYVAAVDSANSAGIVVIGYVYTLYGTRNMEDVVNDIDLYYQQYDIDGIFFDEVSSSVSDISYYEDIANYVYNKGAIMVVNNPGQPPAEAFISIVNTTIIFERSYNDFVIDYENPSYIDDYPSHKFAHLVYDTPTSSNMENAVTLSQQRNSKYIYVTNDILSNPWDTLPAYFDSETTYLCDNSSSGYNSMITGSVLLSILSTIILAYVMI